MEGCIFVLDIFIKYVFLYCYIFGDFKYYLDFDTVIVFKSDNLNENVYKTFDELFYSISIKADLLPLMFLLIKLKSTLLFKELSYF